MSPLPREINWDDVAKAENVPPGKYSARIDKVEEKTSPNNNEYWFLTFTLTDEPYIGKKLFANIMLQPTALWKLRSLMKALSMNTKGVGVIDPQDFLNAELNVSVEHEMYDGELRARVTGFSPLG